MTEWRWRSFQIYPPERHKDAAKPKQYEATAIPLQGKVILCLFKASQDGDDLVLLNVDLRRQPPEFVPQDMSYWAINYPITSDLNVPPFLDGDPSHEIPYIAATEKSAQHTTIHRNRTLAILLDRNTPLPHDLLIFDQLYQQPPKSLQQNPEPQQDKAPKSVQQSSLEKKPQTLTWKSTCTAQIGC